MEEQLSSMISLLNQVRLVERQAMVQLSLKWTKFPRLWASRFIISVSLELWPELISLSQPVPLCPPQPSSLRAMLLPHVFSIYSWTSSFLATPVWLPMPSWGVWLFSSCVIKILQAGEARDQWPELMAAKRIKWTIGLERNLWMPLAAERELRYDCSSEGEGWFLSGRKEKKKCMTAFGLTNNVNINLPWAVTFRLGLITAEQTFPVSCLGHLWPVSVVLVPWGCSHAAYTAPPSRAWFSIKTHAECKLSSAVVCIDQEDIS